MTWIPCSMCHQFPCACRAAWPVTSQPQVQPFVFIPAQQPLSDADVERIADAVKKKLTEKPKRKR